MVSSGPGFSAASEVPQGSPVAVLEVSEVPELVVVGALEPEIGVLEPVIGVLVVIGVPELEIGVLGVVIGVTELGSGVLDPVILAVPSVTRNVGIGVGTSLTS